MYMADGNPSFAFTHEENNLHTTLSSKNARY
jgi:hypothetical protein